MKRANDFGVPYIYKKTDSGFRGNIGSELAGAMDAPGPDEMNFIPAFPSMRRTTKNHIHYGGDARSKLHVDSRKRNHSCSGILLRGVRVDRPILPRLYLLILNINNYGTAALTEQNRRLQLQFLQRHAGS